MTECVTQTRCDIAQLSTLFFLPTRTTPRYRPLSPAENAVCERLCALRTQLDLSQAEFGRRVGASRDQIASIEVARVPVSLILGTSVCGVFNVCQRWLATGKSPQSPSVKATVFVNLDEPKTFLEAYSGEFERSVEEQLSNAGGPTARISRGRPRPSKNARRDMMIADLNERISAAMNSLPEGERDGFFISIAAQIAAFVDRASERTAARKPR